MNPTTAPTATPAPPADAAVATVAGPPSAPRPARRLVVACSLFALAIAVAGYWATGMPDYESVAAQAAALAEGPDEQHLETLVQRLKERLQQQPDDARGWAMLGRAHAMRGRAAEAAQAFEKSLALKGDDPSVLADYAETLAVREGKGLAGEPTALLERALAADPAHPKALALAGAAAFDRQDFAAAVSLWERLVAASPPDAPYLEQVREGISRARQRGGPAQAAPAASPASAAAPPGDRPAVAASPAISGTVSLAPSLTAQVRPDDTLFVYARAAEGPRMPLVILRRQASDLPLAFRLDDGMSMQPSMKLSSVPKVVVVARVSRSGQAAAQPGDLIGESAPVTLGISGLRVEIRERVGGP